MGRISQWFSMGTFQYVCGCVLWQGCAIMCIALNSQTGMADRSRHVVYDSGLILLGKAKISRWLVFLGLSKPINFWIWIYAKEYSTSILFACIKIVLSRWWNLIYSVREFTQRIQSVTYWVPFESRPSLARGSWYSNTVYLFPNFLFALTFIISYIINWLYTIKSAETIQLQYNKFTKFIALSAKCRYLKTVGLPKG